MPASNNPFMSQSPRSLLSIPAAQTYADGSYAAATDTATLPASATAFTEILGFDITGGGATAASVIVCTVTDGTWTLNVADTAFLDTGSVRAVSLHVAGFSCN